MRAASAAADMSEDRALVALLEFYASCGVDLALDEAAHDRYADSAKPPEEAPAPEPAPARPAEAPRPAAPAAARVFPDEAARAAQEAAAGAQTLDELRERLAAFEGCGLKAMARHFLFSAGRPGAPLMVLDFAPGEAEERSGEAFSGPQARLLDAMLRAIGRNRDSAYLAYFSPWRPAGDIAAPPHETAALLPFARRHVELARPKALLLLGDGAAKPMLGTQESGAKLYGKWTDCVCGGLVAPAIVAPSPRAMLAQPIFKRAAWQALRRAAEALA